MNSFIMLSESSKVTSDANEDLRYYAMCGEVKLATHALIKGANVDEGDPVEGNTPLLEASRNGERSYFLVFVPTIREIRDFYREM
eukprot:SAG31_NODE_16308_length_714_cov_0.734959_2_plen_85_part_00